jgi:hypothetical protein
VVVGDVEVPWVSAGLFPLLVAGIYLGVLLTSLVLYGLIERRDRTILRMGYDSVAILFVYLLGIGAIVIGAVG